MKCCSGAARAVRLGSINLLETDAHTHIIRIQKIHEHPEYKSASRYHDIALMQLAEKTYFNEFIRPACINVNTNIQWSKAIATGFGSTSHGNVQLLILHFEISSILKSKLSNRNSSPDSSLMHDRLLKVELDKMPTDKCQRTFSRDTKLQHGIIESQFCAGDTVGNKDTCNFTMT